MKRPLLSWVRGYVFLCLTVMGALGVLSPNAYAELAPEVQAVSTVNINTASADQIAEVLSGIGLKKAEAIVAHRDQYGAFKDVDELVEVKGIGEATVAKNRSRISL